MLGNRLPVPLSGILASARVLHTEWLERLLYITAQIARGYHAGPAWNGCEVALYAYAIACAREYEHRAEKLSLVAEEKFDGIPFEMQARVSLIATAAAVLNKTSIKAGNRVRPTWAVPSILIQYHEPSWMKDNELHVRHRSYLLRSEYGAFYQQLGWRDQISLEEPDITLPPHDMTAGKIRWQLDTSKDW